MLRRTVLTVGGIGAYRAADKLAKAGICVFSVREARKNAVFVEVASKDVKKVFAILRGSCYNVEKVRFRGGERLLAAVKRRAGAIVGAALFFGTVWFAQTRVLRVDVTGNGAYYRDEVTEILSRGGVTRYSSFPQDASALTAEILALPGVSFCAFARSGGILTVEVRVSDDAETHVGPLLSPCAGKVEEAVVLRGTLTVEVGEEVEAGRMLVDCTETVGEGTRSVIVIARVRLSSAVRGVYAAVSGEEALRAAEIEYGELRDARVEKTDTGWLVEGVASVTAAMNLV
ncbi:MAG: sporulation protein YqfD [Candidatus Gallimonas sp.]